MHAQYNKYTQDDNNAHKMTTMHTRW